MKENEFSAAARDAVREFVGPARLPLSELMHVETADQVSNVLVGAGVSDETIERVVARLASTPSVEL